MINVEELKEANILLQKMHRNELSLTEYQQLQYLIIHNEEFLRGCYPIMHTSVSGDKIMYISDTHIGGEDEDEISLQVAYDTALRQNIKTVVHAGDLIEACANNQYDKSKDVIEEEISKALSYMPKEITTKLLMGNHDYSAIRTYPDIVSLFFSNPKLEILGMQKVLLNWDNIATIRVNHKINQLQYNREEDKGMIQLFGHYHTYQFNKLERSIFLPPICDDVIGKQIESLREYGLSLNAPRPIFIISSKQDDHTILFELYCVTRGTHILDNCSDRIEVNCKTRQIKKY